MKLRLATIAVLLSIWADVVTAQPHIVTAAEANGVYSGPHHGKIRILALGHQKLRVQIDAFYEYHNQCGKAANFGTFDGIARIDSNVAVLSNLDFPGCTFRLDFLEDYRLKVTQDGDENDCDFGQNVNATGIYKKVKGGKPKFDN